MMNPLKKMDTAAMKPAQKSAVKKLSPDQKKLDKNKSGDLDSQDFEMLRSSNKIKSSGLRAMGGSTMKSEKSTPLSVSLDKDTTEFYKKVGGAALSSIGSYMMSRAKATSPSGKTKKEKEKKAGMTLADKAASNQGRTEGSGSATANQNAGQTFQDLQKKETGPTEAEAKKAAAGGDRFSKAYEIAKKKYPKAYGKMTLAEYTAEAKKQIANRKETGKYIGGTKKLTEAEKKAAEQKKLKEAAEQKKLKEEKEAADNSDKIVKEAQLEKAKKEAEKAAAEKIRLAKAEEYNKKNLKPRSRSRRKVKVDVVKDKKTGARLKTKTRTRKDGTVKTKVKETRIIGGVASKTRKVEDAKKGKRKKDRNKNRSRVSVGSSPG